MLIIKATRLKGALSFHGEYHRLDEKGYFFFYADNGLKVLNCHGSTDGSLSCGHEMAMRIPPDVVVTCCYPKRVKARYPHINVAMPDCDTAIVGGFYEQTGEFAFAPVGKERELVQYVMSTL